MQQVSKTNLKFLLSTFSEPIYQLNNMRRSNKHKIQQILRRAFMSKNGANLAYV